MRLYKINTGGWTNHSPPPPSYIQGKLHRLKYRHVLSSLSILWQGMLKMCFRHRDLPSASKIKYHSNVLWMVGLKSYASMSLSNLTSCCCIFSTILFVTKSPNKNYNIWLYQFSNSLKRLNLFEIEIMSLTRLWTKYPAFMDHLEQKPNFTHMKIHSRFDISITSFFNQQTSYTI